MKTKESAEQNWLAQNAAALQEHCRWVEKHGTFNDRVRIWKQRQTETLLPNKHNDDD